MNDKKQLGPVDNIFEADWTLLSNMREETRPSVLKAMEKFPGRVNIREDAYDGRGRILPQYYALHTVHGGDLSDFWREYDRLEAIRNG